jgi:polar amino acid transport system substrate-binding protein
MKHPRKALSVAGVGMAISMMALAGCSSGPAASDQSAASSASGDSVSLIRPGTLTVCTHLPYAPFQFNDNSGKTIGFDVDMMDLVAKKLGVEQAIVDTPFEGIKSGQDMSSRKCDIAAAGMTITPERQKVILFSDPYFDATQALLTPEGSTVASLKDLKGKKLGVQSSTTGMDYAEKNASECGCDMIQYQDLASLTQAVLNGQVDAAMNDLPVWSEAMKQNPGAVQIAAQFDTGEQYGFGMRLDNSGLKKVVDQVITDAHDDGTYDEIYKKWIGDTPQS